MTTLVIETNRNERFLVNERNEIIRTDMPFEPSGEWLLRGLSGRVNLNMLISVARLRGLLEAGEPVAQGKWLYENGNPRFTVADYDHGTNRVWGGMAGPNKPYGVTRVYIQN